MLSAFSFNSGSTPSVTCTKPLVCLVTFVVIGAIGIASDANGQSIVDWHTGKRLERFNQTPVSGSWTQTPLRDVLNRFSNSQKVGIFLDRRIDPTTPINIAANNVSPERFLWDIADSQGLGVCRVGDLYFFGAPTTAASLPTLWDQMESQSERQRRNFKVQWKGKAPLTTPPVVVVKDLLQQLANQHQFEIENPEAIPHDVWAKFELPQTSLGGRVGIIVVGFGKWFERSADGKTIKIIDFPTVETALLKTETLPQPRAVAKQMKAKFPDLKIAGSTKRLTASGPPLEVARLRQALVKLQTVTAVAPESNRFNLNTQAPRGSILATVANQLNKKLESPPEIQPILQTEIKLKLADATLTQVLDETLKGTDLKYEMTESELIISAK